MRKRYTIYGIYLFIWGFIFSGCAYRYQERDNTPAGLFRRGEQAMEEHRFNEAHFAFSQLIEKYPQWKYADEALYKKGYLETVLGEYSSAVESFEQLVADYPQSEWRFDAALWSGLIGELNACKGVQNRNEKNNRSKTDIDSEIYNKIKKLEAENDELRRQLQMLRNLLGE